MHAGGQMEGLNFFAAPSAAAGFRISDDGWKRIEDMAQLGGIKASFCRPGAALPLNPRDDLRPAVLRVCEREMDDALGVLLGTACHNLLVHVSFMLDEDRMR